MTLFGHTARMDDNTDAMQEDPVNSPSRGLEETTRTPLHHTAEHHTAGFEIP